MPLPDVLLEAEVLWTAPARKSRPATSHRITSYQAVRQCQTQWCWAAVLLELRRCRKLKAPADVPGESLTLHRFVADALKEKKPDCADLKGDCDAAVPKGCNQVEDIESYLKTMLHKRSFTELEEKELSKALDDDLPIVASFVSATNSRHYAVVTGLAEIEGRHYLEVTDSDGARRIDQIEFEFGGAVQHPDGRELETVFFTRDGW